MVGLKKKKQASEERLCALEARVATLEEQLHALCKEPEMKMPVIPADVMSEWLNGKERN